jgi:hypothetical protein
MYYLAFTMKDPTTEKIRCVGVKYKKTIFSERDVRRITKNGTSNPEIKDWIKHLKNEKLTPVLDILYRGEDSSEACWNKQQIIINHKESHIDLLGIKISDKKYTKKLRINEEMRRPIIDQRNMEYSGVLEAGEQLLLAPSNISKVLHGKLDHIGGYKFRFKQT